MHIRFGIRIIEYFVDNTIRYCFVFYCISSSDIVITMLLAKFIWEHSIIVYLSTFSKKKNNTIKMSVVHKIQIKIVFYIGKHKMYFKYIKLKHCTSLIIWTTIQNLNKRLRDVNV